MSKILKGIKFVLNVFILFVMLYFIFIIFKPTGVVNSSSSNGDTAAIDIQSIAPFILNNDEVMYDSEADSRDTSSAQDGTSNDSSESKITRDEVLKRAEAMTEVKWTPKFNYVDKKAFYIFRRGQTYQGIPYSMNDYQVASDTDFLTKMNNSKILYGNDCSGFVSAAWGISRQTTLSLYNAVNQNKTVDGIAVHEISWDDLKPGDALLLDNGKGKGHIMLFIEFDTKNKDKLYVYEQNIATIIPYEPVPVARKDARSKEKLQKEGYISIRLMNIT